MATTRYEGTVSSLKHNVEPIESDASFISHSKGNEITVNVTNVSPIDRLPLPTEPSDDIAFFVGPEQGQLYNSVRDLKEGDTVIVEKDDRHMIISLKKKNRQEE